MVSGEKRGINKMISKNYSKDLALCILKESTRLLSALTFASLSNNVNWMKTKRRKINKTMKMDKDETMGFQQPANRVNMIYGGDSSFNKRN